MTTVQDNPPAIMIVEDDERLADLTCEYLQTNGLNVTVVSDGEEAIRRIRAEQPDLVVLDLMLPGADGLTVCREVRSAYKNPFSCSPPAPMIWIRYWAWRWGPMTMWPNR